MTVGYAVGPHLDATIGEEIVWPGGQDAAMGGAAAPSAEPLLFAFHDAAVRALAESPPDATVGDES